MRDRFGGITFARRQTCPFRKRFRRGAVAVGLGATLSLAAAFGEINAPPAAHAAPPPRLVLDINPLTSAQAGSDPDGFTAVGSTMFFVAETAADGRELWRTDGREGGTFLVQDLTPGPDGGLAPVAAVGDRLFFARNGLWVTNGSPLGAERLGGSPESPYPGTAAGGLVFFIGYDAEHGRELWRSDGTAEGTVLVKDIHPGTATSAVEQITAAGSNVFFLADDGEDGLKLWHSDGSSDGTLAVAGNIHLLAGRPFATLGNAVYFAGDDEEHGVELWRSDGTVAGTFLVADIVSTETDEGPSSSYPADFTGADDALYFTAYDDEGELGLWKSDGTSAGTVFVSRFEGSVLNQTGEQTVDRMRQLGYPWPPNPPGTRSSQGLTPVGSKVFFHGTDSFFGLWVSDGTPDGTFGVSEVPSDLSDVAAVGDLLFFMADDGENGRELWKSDGTPEGTARVADIRPGSEGSEPRFLAALNGRVFFSADDGTHGREPWTSDGTAEGTVMIRDLWRPSGVGSAPRGITAAGDAIFFSADDGAEARELWRSDGTNGGTVLVRDIAPFGAAYGADPRDLLAVGETVYFSADDGRHGRGLWKSDGTFAGTEAIEDDDYTWSDPAEIVDVDGTLFFSAYNGLYGHELWKSDGTPQGTSMVSDVFPGPVSSGLQALTAAGGLLFFKTTYPLNPDDLWRSDGTEDGTFALRDGVSALFWIAAVGDLLFFDGFETGVPNGRELWASDGSSEGTFLVRDINRNPTVGCSFSAPQDFVDFAGWLLFSADDGVYGRELWRSDGTEEGTVLVKDVFPGRSPTCGCTPCGAPLFFTANVGGTAFFVGDDGVHGQEPWRSDGTTEGTVLVYDINSGAASSVPGTVTEQGPSFGFADVGGIAYFRADDGVHGEELWRSDGTEEGTFLVADIVPGRLGALPEQLVADRGTLYFTADDGVHGRELWALLASCGNGQPNPGEVCDDGNAVEGDGCDSNCTLSGCGNGIVDPGEECDDGNQANGDCCDATCLGDAAGTECEADGLVSTPDACNGSGRCEPACLGDCNSDGTVTVAELVFGVSIAVDGTDVEHCPRVDADGDHAVTVEEIVRAVRRALAGCAFGQSL